MLLENVKSQIKRRFKVKGFNKKKEKSQVTLMTSNTTQNFCQDKFLAQSWINPKN